MADPTLANQQPGKPSEILPSQPATSPEATAPGETVTATVAVAEPSLPATEPATVAATEPSLPTTQTTTGTASLALEESGIEEPYVLGSLLVFPDRLMELFTYNEYGCLRFAQAVEGLAEALEGKGRVFAMLVPTPIAYIEEQWSEVTASQKDAIAKTYSNLDKACGVDVYGALQGRGEEYLYFRTDHHWTALGAYYAYRAFAETAGFQPLSLDAYDSFALPGFLGYLYNLSPSPFLYDHPDTIIYYSLKEPPVLSQPLIYLPSGDQPLSYRIFMGGDYPFDAVYTAVENGKTCAVIKDSYGNAFIPWLVPHYENILIFDPRHYEGSLLTALARYQDIDLIVLDYTLVTRYPEYAEYIEGIR
ncbi:MAG: DHHW family protein [Symbiobacteriaceae bacterium]|nr:DHHW family protein [Symbiobacteriaceae bacterium]